MILESYFRVKIKHSPVIVSTPGRCIWQSFQVGDFARETHIFLGKADEFGLNGVVVKQPQGHAVEIAIQNRLMRAPNGR